MEMKSMQNYLLSLMFCLAFGISAEVVKAKQGEILKFQYKDLPEHRVLELSFYVHILGGWDGTTYDQWSPDRFFCKLDDMTLVDSTFNNWVMSQVLLQRAYF